MDNTNGESGKPDSAVLIEGSEGAEKLLDYAWAAYKLRVEDFRALDSKAATFSGFISIVLTLSTTLLVYRGATVYLAETASFAAFFLQLAACLAVIFLAAAFFCCLLALRCRNNAAPPSIKEVVRAYTGRAYSEYSARDVIIDVVKSLESAEQHRMGINERKSKLVKLATHFILTAFILALLSPVFKFFALIKQTWEAFYG